MIPAPQLEAVALHYLRRLWEEGYFEEEHTDCGGAWVLDEPACSDNATHEQVRNWLVAHGLIQIGFLPMETLIARNIHPKDWLDMWWLEVTSEGISRMAKTSDGKAPLLPSGALDSK